MWHHGSRTAYFFLEPHTYRQGCFFFFVNFGTVAKFFSRITLTPSRGFVFSAGNSDSTISSRLSFGEIRNLGSALKLCGAQNWLPFLGRRRKKKSRVEINIVSGVFAGSLFQVKQHFSVTDLQQPPLFSGADILRCFRAFLFLYFFRFDTYEGPVPA